MQKETVFIKRACGEDAESIWFVRAEAINNIPDSCYSPEARRMWAGAEKYPVTLLSSLAKYSWFVAWKGEQIVGTGCLDTDTRMAEGIFVLPLFQRSGIAGKILNRIEQEAVRLGFSVLSLESTPVAEKFYLQQGFKKIRETSRCGISAIKLRCILMEKKLRTL